MCYIVVDAIDCTHMVSDDAWCPVSHDIAYQISVQIHVSGDIMLM